MKISIKTIKNQQFSIDVDETDTILVVKNKIAALQGLDSLGIKLVHKGKNLADDNKSIQQSEIKQNEFLVMITASVKPPTVVQPPPPTTNPTVPPPTTNKPSTVSNPPTTSTSTTTNTTSTSQTTAPVSQFPPGVNQQSVNKMVNDIVSMGFEKSKVEQALRISGYRSQIAVELIMNNTNLTEIENLQALRGNQVPLADDDQDDQGYDDESGGFGPINPETINQLRTAIAQDPNVLNQFLANLANTNPDLAAAIQQNPEQFMNILTGNNFEGGMDQEGGSHPQINLNAEEEKAVDRLMEYGFEEADVLQAYLACDKDENLALNYLFDKQANGDLLTQFEQPPGAGGSAPQKN